MHMNKRIICAAMAAAALVACEKNEAKLQSVDEETVTFEVTVPVERTKAASDAAESAVSKCQVLVYSASSGVLETYAEAEGSSVSVTCTKGMKEIVALVNAPDMSAAVTLDDLKALRSDLNENSMQSLVMEGSTTVDPSTVETVVVDVRRIVSKVRLVKVETAFEQEEYYSKGFRITSVYLMNVAADKSWLAETADPTEWYNKLGYQSSDCDALLYDSLTDCTLTSADRIYDTEHVFYCYPNPNSVDKFDEEFTPRPTRLVVEAMIGNEKCYYPVSIKGMNQNTAYNVSILVKHPGVQDPNDDIEKDAASVSVNIVGWGDPVEVGEDF